MELNILDFPVVILFDQGTLAMPNYDRVMLGSTKFKSPPQVNQDHITAHKI
jgi:hypothetical protein